jgi:hypothetical protein
MQRPNLSRDTLNDILGADRWLRRSLDPRSDRLKNHDFHVRLTRLWERVESGLTNAVAERLMDPGSDGALISLERVRAQAIAVAKVLGTFDIPRACEPHRHILVEPSIDFLLSLHKDEIVQTTSEQWDRVCAIHELSRSYGLSPRKFMATIPGAQDWVTRLTMSPTTYREQILAQVDARHPDRVRVCIDRFAKSANARFDGAEGQNFSDHLMSLILQGDEYWQYRAMWVARIERKISLLWPGYDQEQLTQDDA